MEVKEETCPHCGNFIDIGVDTSLDEFNKLKVRLTIDPTDISKWSSIKQFLYEKGLYY